MDFSHYPFANNHENHFYVNSFGKSFEIDIKILFFDLKRLKIVIFCLECRGWNKFVRQFEQYWRKDNCAILFDIFLRTNFYQ